MLAIGAGTIPMVFSILAVLKSDSGGFLAAIHHLITHPSEWQVGSPGFFVLLVLSTPNVAKGRRLPPFVPMSRRSMAVITLTSSFLCLGAMLAAATTTMLATGFFTGLAVGQSMTGTMAAQIVLSNAIWLAAAPLLNPWTMGNHSSRVGIVMFTAILNQSGQKVLFYWGILPAGIVCAVLVGFTHLAYYFELKRRFATRDLVDLSPESRMQPVFGGVSVN